MFCNVVAPHSGVVDGPGDDVREDAAVEAGRVAGDDEVVLAGSHSAAVVNSCSAQGGLSRPSVSL